MKLGILLSWILRNLTGAVGSDIHLFVADIKSFDTVDRGILEAVWGFLIGSDLLALNIMLMLGCGLSLLLGLVSLGLGMGVFLGDVR